MAFYICLSLLGLGGDSSFSFSLECSSLCGEESELN